MACLPFAAAVGSTAGARFPFSATTVHEGDAGQPHDNCGRCEPSCRMPRLICDQFEHRSTDGRKPRRSGASSRSVPVRNADCALLILILRIGAVKSIWRRFPRSAHHAASPSEWLLHKVTTITTHVRRAPSHVQREAVKDGAGVPLCAFSNRRAAW
jgi:hypothetical protein